jgi:hypothetical protein
MSADEIHDLDWERWTRLHPDQVDDVRAAWDEALRVGRAEGIRESARLGTAVLVQQLGVFMERLERLATRLNEDEAGSPYWRSR